MSLPLRSIPWAFPAHYAIAVSLLPLSARQQGQGGSKDRVKRQSKDRVLKHPHPGSLSFWPLLSAWLLVVHTYYHPPRPRAFLALFPALTPSSLHLALFRDSSKRPTPAKPTQEKKVPNLTRTRLPAALAGPRGPPRQPTSRRRLLAALGPPLILPLPRIPTPACSMFSRSRRSQRQRINDAAPPLDDSKGQNTHFASDLSLIVNPQGASRSRPLPDDPLFPEKGTSSVHGRAPCASLGSLSSGTATRESPLSRPCRPTRLTLLSSQFLSSSTTSRSLCPSARFACRLSIIACRLCPPETRWLR